MMMTWAASSGSVLPSFSTIAPQRANFPQGGMVLNEIDIREDVVYVTLPDRCSDCGGSVSVVIDKDDLEKMDAATDGFWQYAKPGCHSEGVYLPQKRNVLVGLARLLLDAPRGTWRLFKDGDPLNCRRSNLGLLPHYPRQQDWLWNAPLPCGFTELCRSENYIMVCAERGADNRLMWQYLLERWQFCRYHDISLSVPRIHTVRTSWLKRLTVIVKEERQCYSFDIGDDGARENCQYDVRETEEMAA
jgi:hypothetical protein